MTRNGRLALALGAAAYAAAWAFGSKPLYPVAVGLLLVVLFAWASVRLAKKPMRLVRTTSAREQLEGEDLRVHVELQPESGILPVSVVLVEEVGRLGERHVPLHRAGTGRNLYGSYALRALPRGRYPFGEGRAVLEDPFGLERAEVPLRAGGALLVYPRLVELDRLFSETGAHSPDGRRLLLRRPSGFELHSVREYEHGESLRKVHWRSTARRGQLMVKDLEDSPRDEVAVVLDADAGAVVGESFDVQVRAAGSLLHAHVRRGRRSVLVVNSALGEAQRVHSSDGDWRRALELLAAVEPTGRTPLATLFAVEESPAARALDLVVVTARLAPDLVDRLVQRALARRRASLVYVDAASFANGASAPRPEPMLLRLQGSGVPVAVLRRGDDLAAALGAPELPGVARA
jgi:uncharacterized protein (DUF58 family)